MYKHILVPLDSSASDPVIIKHVRDLAAQIIARVTLIHVAHGYAARNQPRLEESQEMREQRQYLAERTDELAQAGVAVDAILACGDPVAEIVGTADKEGCDLIAMATHGHRLPADLVLGSVAAGVRHGTDIPVLLIRTPRRPAHSEG
jgi:nucleotide-binding universal stress UspA family protein